jgi:hypothetical protein
MSLVDSLLLGIDEGDRQHLLGLIAENINADLNAVAAGAAPQRSHDLGSQPRRSRPRRVKRVGTAATA